MKKALFFTAFTLLTLFLSNNLFAQGVSLAWARTWGNNQQQQVMATAVDSNGNIFVASRFQGTVDFDPGSGTTSFSSGSLYDIAISKFDANGTFLWAKEIGGNGNDYPLDIAVGDSGSIYITGTYSALMDFDPGPGTLNRFPVGNVDVFLIKLDNSGLFKWGISFGGRFQDYGYGLAVDAEDNVYVCGEFRSSADFDPGPGFANRTALRSSNVFVSKYDLNGNFQKVANLGSQGTECGRDVAIDHNKNVIVTGFFSRGPSDFDPGSGIANLYANSDDVFVCKLDSNFNYVWAKDFGGNYDDEAYHLEVDGHGNIYTTGIFGNTVDFDPGSGQHFVVAKGEMDLFLHRFKPNGDFDFVKTWGSDSLEWAYGMERSEDGSIYITGAFTDSLDMDADTSKSNYLVSDSSSVDVFLAKYDSLGNFQFANSLGGAGKDFGQSVSLVYGDAVVGGGFESSNMDFDPGAGVTSYSSAGGEDAFLIRIGNCGEFQSTLDTAICGFFRWAQTGLNYTSSGTYYDTVATSSTCDSIYALVLTVHQPDTTADTVSACDSYLWQANNLRYTISGIYHDTLLNSFGCDSLVSLDLTILKSSSDTDTVVACDSYIWLANNRSYTSSGFYMDTLKNQAGCDSLVFLDLEVNFSSSRTDTVVRCDSYVWPINGQNLTNSGIYRDTLVNSQNCDSVVNLLLTIHNSSSSIDTVTACDRYTWSANSQTHTNSGTYVDTLKNSFGCDSTVTLNLSIRNSNSGMDSVTACDTYFWPTNQQTYNTTGSYTHTLTNQAGCDSLVTLYLNINNSNSGNETITACEMYTWRANSQIYTASGTYIDTLTNQLGCDSIVTLQLTINSPTFSADTITACDRFTWPANNLLYNQSGVYVDTLTNAQNCDSVVSLFLTILNSSMSIDTVESCDYYKWSLNNETYTMSGNYHDTLTNVAGCDSIVTLYLTINKVSDITTETSGDIITANNANASYQWLDCSNNNAPISGETNQSFTATANGDYAVELTENGCVDTSACATVSAVAIIESSMGENLSLYPNPSDGRFTIDLGSRYTKADISITDMSGKQVYSNSFSNTQLVPITLNEPSGIYLITIAADNEKAVVRVRVK